MQTDLLCLKESQICKNGASGICQGQDTFENYFNSLGERFEDPVFCIDKSINIVEHQQFPGISFFSVRKVSFLLNPITAILFYCSPNSSLHSFYINLQIFFSVASR